MTSHMCLQDWDDFGPTGERMRGLVDQISTLQQQHSLYAASGVASWKVSPACEPVPELGY